MDGTWIAAVWVTTRTSIAVLSMYLHLPPEYGSKILVRSVGNPLPDYNISQPRTVLQKPHIGVSKDIIGQKGEEFETTMYGAGKEAAVMSGKWQRDSCLSWPPGLAISEF